MGDDNFHDELDDDEAKRTARRLLDQLPGRQEDRLMKFIPVGAMIYHLDGVCFTTLRSGRYIAVPDALQALRDIMAHGDAWSATRARKGLGLHP